MKDSGGSGAVVPAQILVETVPPDDAGAETLDRFEWQCAMATADVLALYEQSLSGSCDDSHELICEHHEDWSLRDGTNAEIVSAKHHEREFGTYSTLKQLLDDGGVLHLFDRWNALQRAPICRVVTTPALSSDAQKFEKACAHFKGQTGDDLDFGPHADLMTKLVTEVQKRRAAKSNGGTPDPAQDPAQDPPRSRSSCGCSASTIVVHSGTTCVMTPLPGMRCRWRTTSASRMRLVQFGRLSSMWSGNGCEQRARHLARHCPWCSVQPTKRGMRQGR